MGILIVTTAKLGRGRVSNATLFEMAN